MSQVHKEQLTAVENALPNRSSLDVEIFGMEGVPEDIIQGHNQRVISQFQQAEVERQAVTGNPPPGTTSGGQQPAKKPKLESAADLKKRLAEHKAKKAEMRAGGSSGEATPVGAGQSLQTPGGYGQSPQTPATASPFSAPASTQPYAYPQPYGTAAATATAPYPQTTSPVYQNYSPGTQQPITPAAYTPSGYSPQPFQAGVATSPTIPAYSNGQTPFAQAQQHPPAAHTPPQTSSAFPPRHGSLPAAPSLPQRPAVGAPQVNAQQMQQMHLGNSIPSGVAHNTYGQPGLVNGDQTPVSTSMDSLISGAAKQADEAAAVTATSQKPAEPTEEKPSKKDKSKPARLVYSDNETSPEEKMAKLPRYAFVPDRKQETVLGEGPAIAVTGTVRETDKVVDPTHY